MTDEIKNNIYTDALANQTKKLALDRGNELQRLSENGHFDHSVRTINIEQEVFAVDRATGKPLDVENFMLNNDLGVRPDTTYYTIEYDANEITPVTVEGIFQL